MILLFIVCNLFLWDSGCLNHFAVFDKLLLFLSETMPCALGECLDVRRDERPLFVRPPKPERDC
jgi:hypothetical protein